MEKNVKNKKPSVLLLRVKIVQSFGLLGEENRFEPNGVTILSSILINRMIIALGAKIGCFLKGDFFFTVDPICLYGLVFTPTAAVYYHVERAISIKREGQIPKWFAFIFPALFSTVTARPALSLLKLNYFSHFSFNVMKRLLSEGYVIVWFSLHKRYQFESSIGTTSF